MGKTTASLKSLELHEQLQVYFSWTLPESPGERPYSFAFQEKTKLGEGMDNSAKPLTLPIILLLPDHSSLFAKPSSSVKAEPYPNFSVYCWKAF